jgi:hypothetical protein
MKISTSIILIRREREREGEGKREDFILKGLKTRYESERHILHVFSHMKKLDLKEKMDMNKSWGL